MKFSFATTVAAVLSTMIMGSVSAVCTGERKVIDFSDKVSGDVLNSLILVDGLVRIQSANVKNRQGRSVSRTAMIFDTDNYTGGDEDLGVNKGKALIISQNNKSQNANDLNGSGDLVFTFTTPVEMESILMVDIEKVATATFYDIDGNMISSKSLPTMGNKEFLEDVEVAASGVQKMVIHLESSGAITDIAFCTPPPPPGTFGDPHFNTFVTGESYDYHGICDLLFVESPANNMEIQIRTTEKFHYSYVSSAVIKLNDDVFEFGSHGVLIANGIVLADDEEHPATIGGHKLTVTRSDKKTHTSIIDFGAGVGVEVKSYKEMVAVRLLGSHTDFLDSRGLMGSPVTGQKLGRDGQIWTEDDNAFGQEWQVTADESMLFWASRAPQAPAMCIVPNPELKAARRLGESMARSEAEQACSEWKTNKEACITDVMLTGDKDLAAAFNN